VRTSTLDAPFSWYVDASGATQQRTANRPGLHFAVFVPASGKFHAARLAMDGVLPDGTNLRNAPVTLPNGTTAQPNGANLADACRPGPCRWSWSRRSAAGLVVVRIWSLPCGDD
jgi:hypothetical protein